MGCSIEWEKRIKQNITWLWATRGALTRASATVQIHIFPSYCLVFLPSALPFLLSVHQGSALSHGMLMLLGALSCAPLSSCTRSGHQCTSTAAAAITCRCSWLAGPALPWELRCHPIQRLAEVVAGGVMGETFTLFSLCVLWLSS